MQQIDRSTDSLPLLPLKDIVVFPHMTIPVFISEDVCIRAVEAAEGKEKFVFLSTFRVEGKEEETSASELKSSTPAPFDVFDVGTVASVLRIKKLPDGRVKVLLQGVARANIVSMRQTEPYPVVNIRLLANREVSQETDNICRAVKELLEKIVTFKRSLSYDAFMFIEDITEPAKLSDIIAGNLGFKIMESQKILATLDPVERLRKLHILLLRELELHQVHARISTQARENANKNQREQYLREQIRALRHELGEYEGKDEIEELREKIIKAQMSPDGFAECTKQIRRLERMNQDSSEASLTRSYLEWMTDLPWAKMPDSQIELSNCKQILDEDHFGLEKIKDRILEYIAIRKLNPQSKGPILCFVGPPGVGKTSLGKSIAKALGRKFVRISLGGVHDEAEIRGHRRTYVGALPGRIIQTLKTVQARNPVMMLDEIDKLGSDHKGDPSHALLEVLDPEQNHSFSDHYISVPFDLSQIIFLANANRLDSIPGPLRDRLEIIDISGYSEEEKLEIAKSYIVPKVITHNGLSTDLVQFQDSALNFVINSYTRESGLRNLEKKISAIARKIARYVAENDEKGKERKSIKVTQKIAKEMLGEEHYFQNDLDIYKKRVGVGIGLAYTQSGGEILELEVKLLPGSGRLILTGQLGDVMKESAHTALTCVRSLCGVLGIDINKFAENDIHLHVPAGGIPKDGPSAGMAIAMTIVSAFKNESLRQDVAVTGEITLNGRILPIGGVREKVLAALRAGIKKICLPEKNRGSFAELSLSLRKRVNVRFISTLEEVLLECFHVNENDKEKSEEDKNSELEDSLLIEDNISAA